MYSELLLDPKGTGSGGAQLKPRKVAKGTPTIHNSCSFLCLEFSFLSHKFHCEPVCGWNTVWTPAPNVNPGSAASNTVFHLPPELRLDLASTCTCLNESCIISLDSVRFEKEWAWLCERQDQPAGSVDHSLCECHSRGKQGREACTP